MNRLPAQYGDALSKYAYRFFGYRPHMLPVVEDAVQETFIKAIGDVEVLMRHPNQPGWLRTALKHILLTKCRAISHRKEELYAEEAQVPAMAAVAMQQSLERWQSRITLPEVIGQAERLLTKDEMETFVDHYLIGLTTEEAAAQECVTPTTVRGRLSRIRKKMKTLLL